MAQPRVLRAGGSSHAALFFREAAERLRDCRGTTGKASTAAPATSGDQRTPSRGEAAAGSREARQASSSSSRELLTLLFHVHLL